MHAYRVGELMFPIAQAHIDGVMLVTDDAIRVARRMLWEGLRLVAEHRGPRVIPRCAKSLVPAV